MSRDNKLKKDKLLKVEYTVGMGFDAQPIVATHYVTIEKQQSYVSNKWYQKFQK